MQAELQGVVIGVVITAILTAGAVIKLLPPFIKRQMDIYQKSQEDKIAIEKKKGEDALEEARQERLSADEQRKQFSRLVDSLIAERESQSKQSEVMVKALTGSVAVLDGMKQELRANTSITSEIPKELGALTDRFDELLDTGSKPLQELRNDVKELGKGVAEIKTSQRDTTDKVNFIHEKIVEINALKTSLEVMLSVAQAKLEDIRKATDENNKVNLVIPSTT